MDFDFVGDLAAAERAIVVIVDFARNIGDEGFFFEDQVRLGIKENVPLDAGRIGQLKLQRIAALNFGLTFECSADLALGEILQAGVVILSGRLKLQGLRTEESIDFGGGGLMPGGFTVVGFDESFAVGV